MKILQEMAYERKDAINRCGDLGELFIEHFKKVVDEGINSSDFIHHCKEMQAWFNKVKIIKFKSNHKTISNTQLIDWFFTIGSDIETVLEEQYRDKYENFILQVLLTKNIENSFLKVLNNNS